MHEGKKGNEKNNINSASSFQKILAYFIISSEPPPPSYVMYELIHSNVLNEKLFCEPTAPFSREFPLKFLITPNNGIFFKE